ncbi:Calmodulin-like protein 5, partial [Lunasporangiospora selenospora]
ENINTTEAQEVFDQYDRNKNGTINVTELRAAFKDLNQDVSEEDIEGVISDIDTDNDGELNFEEFITLISLLNNAS